MQKATDLKEWEGGGGGCLGASGILSGSRATRAAAEQCSTGLLTAEKCGVRNRAEWCVQKDAAGSDPAATAMAGLTAGRGVGFSAHLGGYIPCASERLRLRLRLLAE